MTDPDRRNWTKSGLKSAWFNLCMFEQAVFVLLVLIWFSIILF